MIHWGRYGQRAAPGKVWIDVGILERGSLELICELIRHCMLCCVSYGGGGEERGLSSKDTAMLEKVSRRVGVDARVNAHSEAMDRIW
jgi:hypothetical protein